MSERSVVVIGGGIAGLSAAYRLRELAAQRGERVEVTVLERSARTGGCVETLVDDGFVIELGPDSLLTEKAAGIGLVRRLGLESQVIPTRPEFRGARVVRGGRLVPVPDDFRFFTPTSLLSLLTTRLFSPAGIVRAAMEPLVPVKKSADDESLASFVTRRFGREVLERLAQPLIGGIYSGDPQRLSMRATMPQFVEIERRYGSLVHAMRKMRLAAASSEPAGSRLVSLREGLGTVTRALARELGEAVRTSSDVSALHYAPSERGEPWSVALADGSVLEAGAVVCALPAFETARLVAPMRPRLAELLRRIRYHSVATITTAFAAHQVPALPRATGFVVPSVEKRSILATTFSSQKYVNRAPEGSVLLRSFAGGALQPIPANQSEAELIANVRTDLRELVGITAEPTFSIVRRWQNVMPEYSLGHLDLVEAIEQETAALPGLTLAGSAYHGAGLPDCIATGEKAAEAIFTLPATIRS
jgi:oxygen-dependent protoporphyrinogen oxidase